MILSDHLLNGSKQTSSAGYLLASGALVLLGMNIAFALLYWEFDLGGPLARLERAAPHPDMAFPQQVKPRSWRCPAGVQVFVDSLYLGFTNNTAFSPTDVMPLAPWAKLAMAVQATLSLIVIGLVLAHTVNVFS